MLRILTDEGIEGLGEVSCTPRWSGEDQVTAAHFIATILEPLLLGRDPRDVERLSASLRRALSNNPFTHAGLEMALWDILGKAAGLPLYRLLGGPVRDVVPTKFSVSGLEPARAAEIAAWAAEQGYRVMKVKVGHRAGGGRAAGARRARGGRPGRAPGRRRQRRLVAARGHPDRSAG